MSETLTRNYISIDYSLVASVQVSCEQNRIDCITFYCSRLSIFVPISCNVLVALCRYFLFQMALSVIANWWNSIWKSKTHKQKQKTNERKKKSSYRALFLDWLKKRNAQNSQSPYWVRCLSIVLEVMNSEIATRVKNFKTKKKTKRK